jgi:hypothetical protein
MLYSCVSVSFLESRPLPAAAISSLISLRLQKHTERIRQVNFSFSPSILAPSPHTFIPSVLTTGYCVKLHETELKR